MSIHAVAWNKDPRDVVFRPVVSEKSYTLIDQGKYTFEVDPRATKTEIKLAIEKIFNVKVSAVNTLNKTGKMSPCHKSVKWITPRTIRITERKAKRGAPDFSPLVT